MFIKLTDVGVKRGRKDDVIGVDNTALEHGNPVYLRKDLILAVTENKLLDGHTVGVVTVLFGDNAVDWYVQEKACTIIGLLK